ncbi:hypothetical protein ACJX0J_032345 [Zea mays]
MITPGNILNMMLIVWCLSLNEYNEVIVINGPAAIEEESNMSEKVVTLTALEQDGASTEVITKNMPLDLHKQVKARGTSRYHEQVQILNIQEDYKILEKASWTTQMGFVWA